jgi:hypothetical protein
MNRKSSKLERQATSQNKFETRTRSALSFDINTDDQDKPSTTPQPSPTLKSVARISRRLFTARTDSSSGDSHSNGKKDGERSPNGRYSSRALSPRSNLQSGDSSEVERESSSPSRSSRKFFSKSMSLLKSTSKQQSSNSDNSIDDNDSLHGRGKVEEFQLSPQTVNRFFSRTEAAGSTGEVSGSSDTPSKRISGRGFFSPRRSAAGRGNDGGEASLPSGSPIQADPVTMILFQKVMAHRPLRDELVQILLASHTDGLPAKVRFVSAVNEYEKTSNKADKVAKGRKIMTVFVQKDAMFPISGLSAEDQDVGAELDNLLMIRTAISCELVANPSVKKFLDGLDIQSFSNLDD